MPFSQRSSARKLLERRPFILIRLPFAQIFFRFFDTVALPSTFLGRFFVDVVSLELSYSSSLSKRQAGDAPGRFTQKTTLRLRPEMVLFTRCSRCLDEKPMASPALNFGFTLFPSAPTLHSNSPPSKSSPGSLKRSTTVIARASSGSSSSVPPSVCHP